MNCSNTITHAVLGAVLLAPSTSAQTPPEPPSPPVRAFSGVLASGSFLGVAVAEIDADRAKTLKLKEEYGVEITRLEEDSPAAKAGLKVGDVVLEYNGQRVEGTEQFVRLVRETPPGRQAKLLVSREGATQTITATIGKARAPFFRSGGDTIRFQLPRIDIPEIADVPKVSMYWRTGVLGIEAESLESQLAEYFGVSEGVLVRSVISGSAAERAGLKAGDVIVKVDNTKVATPREISNAIRSMQSKKTFPLQIVRNQKEMTLTVTLDTGTGETPAPARRTVRNAPLKL